MTAQATGDRSVPIVLVHGLLGWGRSEALGVPYFGGLQVDVQEDLKRLGYSVYTASVGPISSNWDRAAELYAQIKGGCVDYGAAHASSAGHSRSDPDKCYPGFYPQWDAQHPVNLIGHSLGGPTSLLLVKLLEDGSPANAANGNLYTGGRRGWVKSVMTVSGTNTGSPAADNLQTMLPFLKDLVLSLAGTAGAGNGTLYNFDLGQWGFRRQAGESFQSYTDRVFDPAQPFWKSTDQAAYALEPDSASAENAFIGRSPDTRYFSWETVSTYRGLLSGWQYPTAQTNPIFAPIAYPYAWPLSPGLGNLGGRSLRGTFTYDSSWWENDGIVPVKVMNAPLGQTYREYTPGTVTQPGQWYRLGRLNNVDHLDVVGQFTTFSVRDFYRNQAAFLSNQ